MTFDLVFRKTQFHATVKWFYSRDQFLPSAKMSSFYSSISTIKFTVWSPDSGLQNDPKRRFQIKRFRYEVS